MVFFLAGTQGVQGASLYLNQADGVLAGGMAWWWGRVPAIEWVRFGLRLARLLAGEVVRGAGRAQCLHRGTDGVTLGEARHLPGAEGWALHLPQAASAVLWQTLAAWDMRDMGWGACPTAVPRPGVGAAGARGQNCMRAPSFQVRSNCTG